MRTFSTRILLAIDGSKQAELAARTAVDLAANTDSELHIVTVARLEPCPSRDIPESGGYLKRMYASIEREAQEVLDEQVKKIEKTGGIIPQVHFGRRRPDREIVRLADEIGAGLIIMGSRGRGGVRSALMGSVSDSVVRHAHCPVLVMREET